MKTLSELREERNITQVELARDLGCAPSTIAMYETGERTPPLNKAKSIAQYFGVKIDDIFFGNIAHESRAGTQ